LEAKYRAARDATEVRHFRAIWLLAGAWHALRNKLQGRLLGQRADGSFFATLKGELVEERDYLTRDEARADVLGYVEDFYNRRRLQSAIGYFAPERKVELAAAA